MDASSPGTTRLTLGILGLVLLGTPLVAYLWHTLNDLLQGEIHPPQLLWSVPAAIALAALLWLTWGVIQKWQASYEREGSER